MADKKGKEYSASEKLDYYKKRAADPKLTESQRNFAVNRINSLQSGSSSSGSRSSDKASNTRNNFGGSKSYTVTIRPGK